MGPRENRGPKERRTPLGCRLLELLASGLELLGSLDDPGAIRPVHHWGVEARLVAWHAPDGLPEHRTDDDPKHVARWKAAYGDDGSAT